jgi:hypothetical protein
MTNGEKFKTAEERHTEFSNWCYERECDDCELHFCNCPEGCAFHWLNLKYKEELKPCPFCGCNKQDESLDTLLKAINQAFIYGGLPKDSKPAKTLRNCDRYANRKEAFAEWVFYNSRQKIGVIRWVDFVDWLFAESKGDAK